MEPNRQGESHRILQSSFNARPLGPRNGVRGRTSGGGGRSPRPIWPYPGGVSLPTFPSRQSPTQWVYREKEEQGSAARDSHLWESRVEAHFATTRRRGQSNSPRRAKSPTPINENLRFHYEPFRALLQQNLLPLGHEFLDQLNLLLDRFLGRAAVVPNGASSAWVPFGI